MYTDEYENRGFPFRNFLLKLILIIIFVFLLVWLLPKFIAPAVNKDIKNSNENTTQINALTSQIFADNLNKMKEAAISYYTDERLPENDGEFKQMTLSEMIGLKLITPLIDKNNKAVDVEASYVKITKSDNEYILKVNIKDSEKEDYILVHLGCYTYCKGNICEKKSENIVIKGSTIKADTPITKKYYCQIANGKYYGKSGNVVNKNTYESECITKPVEKHYCAIVNDKYYGKNGTVVSKETYEDECTTKPVEKHYCAIVNGKYYDKNGNVVDKNTYEESCNTKEYLYEYARTINTTFSSWTKWSNWLETSCSTKAITCNENDVKCLREVKLYNRKEKIGTHEQEYIKERSVQIKASSYTEKTCKNYSYVIVNNTTYAVTNTYTNVTNITSSTASSVAGWNYEGRGTYANPPRDTEKTHYVFVGADYSYCSDTCTTLPNYYYDKYTYTGNMSKVSKTTEAPVSSSSQVVATCTEYETKTVNIYRNITKTEIATRTEPLYGTVCYSSDRTRKLTSTGKTEKKWSYYNDTNLLNNNWYYTGAKKLK